MGTFMADNVRFYLWQLRKPTNNLIVPASVFSFSLDVKHQNFTFIYFYRA